MPAARKQSQLGKQVSKLRGFIEVRGVRHGVLWRIPLKYLEQSARPPTARAIDPSPTTGKTSPKSRRVRKGTRKGRGKKPQRRRKPAKSSKKRKH